MRFPTLKRARPRGLRPSLPAATHSTLLNAPNQFGTTALPYVFEGQALGLPAAFRAVNLIANGVASMAPMELWSPDGVTKLATPPVVGRPLATMTTFDFWHMAVAAALMRGNFLGIQADLGPSGFPNQIVPVHPDFAYAYIDAAGYTVYNVTGVLYSADQVVHVRAFTTIGAPWGIGVVENFRRALGQQLDQQNLVASTYKTGSVPTVVIELDRPEVDKIQATATQDQWIESHGNGQRKPAVIPNTMKVTPLSFSPEDSQFLEARQMSVAEVAFMFNLDPSDLGASVGGASLTYANLEQRQQQRVTDAYGPMMLRFEQAWSDLTPGGNAAKFCPEGLLRTDSKTRAEVHQLNIATGVELVDEARIAEGRPALTEEQKAERKPPPAVVPTDPSAPTDPPQPTDEGADLAVTDPKVKL
jgi:HK97 family phage portal protein